MFPLGQDNSANALDPIVVLILVILITAIAVIFVIYTRTRIARRTAEEGTPRERIEAIKSRSRAETGLDARLVELLDTAQRLTAQLDAKAVRLEELIDQADERIGRLGGTESPDDSFAMNRAGSDADETGGEPDPLAEDIVRLADEGFTPVEIAQRLEETTGKVELVLALRKSRAGEE